MMARKNLFLLKRQFDTLCKNTRLSWNTARCQSGWTQEKTILSPYNDIEIPNMTIQDYIWQNLDKWPERTATVCAETGRGYTYEQAFKLSHTFAANLRKKFNVNDGETVAVMLPNIPDYPLVILGILTAGGVVTTLNPVYTAHEVQRQLLMSNTKLIVTLPQLHKTVKEALNIAKLNIPIISVKTNGESVPDGTADFSELIQDTNIDKSCLKGIRISPKDIAIIPYSSGTTGLPKGVELSHRNMVANSEQFGIDPVKTNNETTATHQDAIMGVLPFFHIYGLSVVMLSKLAQGTKLVTVSKFQPELFLQALHRCKTNILFAAPPIIILMTKHPLASPKLYEHLEMLINGAAPLSPGDADRFIEKANKSIDFRHGYGLTETSPVVSLTYKGMEDHGSVGHALPKTELKIADADMKSLGPNQTGELLVKGPQVMRGYRENPKANSESFTVDGWYRTGDLATIDENGKINIVDRLKELIKVKGFQVPPAELEAVLREIPEVTDAAVVGIPHPTNGEAPKAFIVLKPGAKQTPKDICEFVKEKVAVFKRIDEENVMFLDNIPKSAAGKILRKDLRAKYC